MLFVFVWLDVKCNCWVFLQVVNVLIVWLSAMACVQCLPKHFIANRNLLCSRPASLWFKHAICWQWTGILYRYGVYCLCDNFIKQTGWWHIGENLTTCVRHPKGKVVSSKVIQYCSCLCWWHMRCWVFNWRQSTLMYLHNQT